MESIKKKSTINKKKKNHDKIWSLAKFKLNSVKVLISKALIYSNFSHDEFVLINKYTKRIWWNQTFQWQIKVIVWNLIVWNVEKIQKVKTQKL